MFTLDLGLIAILVGGLAALALLKVLFEYAARQYPSLATQGFHFPGTASLTIAGLLFVVFILFWMSIPMTFSHVYAECRFLEKLQSDSPLELPQLVLASLILAWLIARYQHEFWEYNGFGTKLYVSDPDPLRPWIGTKWLVALLIPVMPVRSYEVLAARQLSWDHKAYSTEPLDSVDWDQVTDTVRKSWWIYALVTLGIIAMSVLSVFPCLTG